MALLFPLYGINQGQANSGSPGLRPWAGRETTSTAVLASLERWLGGLASVYS